MEIQKKEFSTTKDGLTVTEYLLINDKGYSIGVLDRGGILHQINIPDRNGVIKNVSLSYDDMHSYENSGGYIGATIGRVAGRISKAQFEINGTTYKLAANDNTNTLHGGLVGFDQKFWEVTEQIDKDSAQIVLHYLSPDMEEGFPGTLDTMVTFSFNNDNAMTIAYKATSDKTTYVNMTNHCYFNLSGDFSKTVYKHELMINADKYTPVTSEIMATGLDPVEGTVFDFRKAKPVGQDIEKDIEQLNLAGGYDHAFDLNQPSDSPLIEAYDPESGRSLSMTTDAACVVFYSGNGINPSFPASGDVPVGSRHALCLETQYYPDQVNAPFVETVLLQPGKTYQTSTTYKFGIK